MIKKLALLLCLGLAVPVPVAATPARNVLEAAKIGAGVACVAGTACLIASYPEAFGKFFGALIRVLADYHYCHHCDYHDYHHCHYRHVTVTTTYRY
jgi:hypothetical protein